MDPMSMASLGIGALGGLFGSGQAQMPPEMQAIYKRMMQLYKLRLQFAQGVPGSAPGEMASLAQAKGLAGQQMGNAYGDFLAARGARGTTSGSDADATRVFGESQAGNLANMDMAGMMQFMQNRNNAFGELPGILGAAGGVAAQGYQAAQQPVNPLQGLASAAYAFGQNRGASGGGAVRPMFGSVKMSPPTQRPNYDDPSMPLISDWDRRMASGGY